MADRYHHGHLREALVSAGGEILARDGAGAVTLRAVAKAAGVSHAAPYHHFRDRDDLLAAIAVPGLVDLTDRLRDAAATESADAAARIRAVARAWIEEAIRRPEAYRLVFGPCSAHEGLAEVSGEAFGVLLEVVTAGQAAGVVARGPAAGLATFLWAAVHGLACLFTEGRVNVGEGPLRDRLVDSLTARILDGIGNREA